MDVKSDGTQEIIGGVGDKGHLKAGCLKDLNRRLWTLNRVRPWVSVLRHFSCVPRWLGHDVLEGKFSCAVATS